jgi:hypothetical protein
MAVAIAALVIAIAGTAVASVGTISVLTKNDKKQIKKIAGKVADQRIRSASSGLVVRSAGSADTAKVADTAKAADSAKVAGTATVADSVSSQLWAIVHADGTLLRGSPGIVSAGAEEAGKNVVLSNRDVQNCFFVATLGGDKPGEGVRGEISVNPMEGEPNAVYVRTGEPGLNAAKPFTLLISC